MSHLNHSTPALRAGNPGKARSIVHEGANYELIACFAFARRTEFLDIGSVCVTMAARVAEAPTTPPFEFTAADRKRLGF
jgi:hypothetical protein